MPPHSAARERPCVPSSVASTPLIPPPLTRPHSPCSFLPALDERRDSLACTRFTRCLRPHAGAGFIPLSTPALFTNLTVTLAALTSCTMVSVCAPVEARHTHSPPLDPFESPVKLKLTPSTHATQCSPRASASLSGSSVSPCRYYIHLPFKHLQSPSLHRSRCAQGKPGSVRLNSLSTPAHSTAPSVACTSFSHSSYSPLSLLFTPQRPCSRLQQHRACA